MTDETSSQEEELHKCGDCNDAEQCFTTIEELHEHQLVCLRRRARLGIQERYTRRASRFLKSNVDARKPYARLPPGTASARRLYYKKSTKKWKTLPRPNACNEVVLRGPEEQQSITSMALETQRGIREFARFLPDGHNEDQSSPDECISASFKENQSSTGVGLEGAQESRAEAASDSDSSGSGRTSDYEGDVSESPSDSSNEPLESNEAALPRATLVFSSEPTDGFLVHFTISANDASALGQQQSSNESMPDQSVRPSDESMPDQPASSSDESMPDQPVSSSDESMPDQPVSSSDESMPDQPVSSSNESMPDQPGLDNASTPDLQ